MPRSNRPRLIIENKQDTFRLVAEGHIAWAVLFLLGLLVFLFGGF